jgi:hypothetical protein
MEQSPSSEAGSSPDSQEILPLMEQESSLSYLKKLDIGRYTKPG